MSTTVRVNNEIKAQVMPILNTLGISLGDAVNMFLHQVKMHNGIPFELIARPYVGSPAFWADVEETRAAVANGTTETYKSTDEFMKAVEAL
ncbi:MAG: type II toxin-antitoxin system RelB/DinJ family antitoxin [Clostridiales bacterium]|nr:type II toxin-antitoxin system RelB/DinJ family antitoxin [Clostridiales bacterium]